MTKNNKKVNINSKADLLRSISASIWATSIDKFDAEILLCEPSAALSILRLDELSSAGTWMEILVLELAFECTVELEELDELLDIEFELLELELEVVLSLKELTEELGLILTPKNSKESSVSSSYWVNEGQENSLGTACKSKNKTYQPIKWCVSHGVCPQFDIFPYFG